MASMPVYRINCMCWHDKTPPDSNTIKALDILYSICIHMTETDGVHTRPAIVHCLAGVGRTGVFVFYHMLRSAVLRGTVTQDTMHDAFIDLFLYLRCVRTWMVQAPRQMQFLCNIFMTK